MATKQNSGKVRKNGISVAGRNARGNPVYPIDTLVVQQLENLLAGERALKARYSSIEPNDDTPEVRMAFSQELSELKDRADRLFRFMDAMDYYGSVDYASLTSSKTKALRA